LLLLVAAAFCSTPQDAIVCGLAYELLCVAVQVFAKGKGRKMAAPMMPGGQMVSSLTQLSRKSSIALQQLVDWQLQLQQLAVVGWHESHYCDIILAQQSRHAGSVVVPAVWGGATWQQQG
jgi:hypothetical protein